MSMYYKKRGPKDSEYQNTQRREYLFTGVDEHKDKINEFRPRLESLVAKRSL